MFDVFGQSLSLGFIGLVIYRALFFYIVLSKFNIFLVIQCLGFLVFDAFGQSLSLDV
jgi:hypothetical protein